jgi:four helix bundle protein
MKTNYRLMENQHHWNSMYYLVSEVYRSTGRIYSRDPENLTRRIRQTAISVSAAINESPASGTASATDKLCPVLSALSVLETYLELARKHGMIKEPRDLFQQILAIKRQLNSIMEERNEPLPKGT